MRCRDGQASEAAPASVKIRAHETLADFCAEEVLGISMTRA